jgi:hypothetical protein
MQAGTYRRSKKKAITQSSRPPTVATEDEHEVEPDGR